MPGCISIWSPPTCMQPSPRGLNAPWDASREKMKMPLSVNIGGAFVEPNQRETTNPRISTLAPPVPRPRGPRIGTIGLGRKNNCPHTTLPFVGIPQNIFSAQRPSRVGVVLSVNSFACVAARTDSGRIVPFPRPYGRTALGPCPPWEFICMYSALFGHI